MAQLEQRFGWTLLLQWTKIPPTSRWRLLFERQVLLQGTAILRWPCAFWLQELLQTMWNKAMQFPVSPPWRGTALRTLMDKYVAHYFWKEIDYLTKEQKKQSLSDINRDCLFSWKKSVWNTNLLLTANHKVATPLRISSKTCHISSMNLFTKQNHAITSDVNGMKSITDLPKINVQRTVCILSIGIILNFGFAPLMKSKQLSSTKKRIISTPDLAMLDPKRLIDYTQAFFWIPQLCWWVWVLLVPL